jgi:hypothetical protein
MTDILTSSGGLSSLMIVFSRAGQSQGSLHDNVQEERSYNREKSGSRCALLQRMHVERRAACCGH